MRHSFESFKKSEFNRNAWYLSSILRAAHTKKTLNSYCLHTMCTFTVMCLCIDVPSIYQPTTTLPRTGNTKMLFIHQGLI